MLSIFFAFCITLWIQKIRAQGTLGLQNGFTTHQTPEFALQLVSDSQTAYSLKPVGSDFNFIPSDYMVNRQNNRQYHLGDITIRARVEGASTWTTMDSAANRKPVTKQSVSGNTLAQANLAPTFGSSLLNVTRRWVVEDGVLQLLFDINNPQNRNVLIGSIGAPLEFNNIFTGRTAEQTNTRCSLTDPYIGQDAGFVQVTPLLGTLPPLVVIPVKASPLEGWRNLDEPSTEASYWYGSQTFEGLFEWLFHTRAYAENEWTATTPWNEPTSHTLLPGQTRTYGLQFLLADSIPEIESRLIEAGHPVAAGLPGYVLPSDQPAKLFLRYSSPVQSISTSPSGSLSWKANSDSSTWEGYDITGLKWGRSRLSVTYEDGTVQTIHYFVTHDAVKAVADLGRFLTTKQWFEDDADPFGRSPSIISYDREVDAVVKNDPRAWIPGLSDEAGAGSWLAAAMKQYLQPNAEEVAKFERFVNETLWGSVQNTNGTVKKAVFFYEPSKAPEYNYPSNIDWRNWWSWNQAASYDTGRAYDYVHVIAAHWAMYRVARNYPSLTSLKWDWYLDKAVLTVDRMTGGSVGYVDVGLMGETVIQLLLDDLFREEWGDEAALVGGRMRTRQAVWSRQRFPFGSEMAWDSTGQEGIYVWSRYFGDGTTAVNAINSILAYQPLVPHWGYNGNARRYWDNIYGGKLQRIERQIHHYGSGLNALPLIDSFLKDPDNFFLLRLAYGGLSGALSNIDEEGFASASFHSWPDTMKWDAYSGDYGPNFSGHAMGIGTFVVEHPDFGWQAFGGRVVSSGKAIVEVEVLDTGRRKVFIGSIAALLRLDAGAFERVVYDMERKEVTVTIRDAVGSGAAAPVARLLVGQTVDGYGGGGILKPSGNYDVDAGAFVIPFTGGEAQVRLSI